jgi:uncharacterized protein (DUF342 family)
MKSLRKVEDNAKTLELLVSDDKLKLFLKVDPKQGHAFVQEEDLVKEILSITAEDMLDRAIVKDIAREVRMGKPGEARRVAKGFPAEPGRDGKIVWLVRRFTPGKKEENRQQEFTDFFTLGLFENIEIGRELARVYKPTLGTSGRDIFGKEIFAAPGKPFEPKINESISRKPAPDSETFDLLLASVNGYVHEEGGLISVRETLQLPGDVDYSIGHINFIGGVKIGGDVLKGFHVKAQGNIEVAGSLLGDNVISSVKSIVVKGFHHGGESGAVSAGGNYSVSVAHGVSSEVHGNIFVEREARDCALRSLSAVFSDRGAVVGGTVWCVKGFEGATLGNEAGALTTVELRNEVEVTLEYKALSENIGRHQAARAAIELHAGPYLKNRKRIAFLRADFRIKIEALLKKYDQIDASLQSLLEEEKRMRESKARLSDARINVTKGVFPGVTLSSGSVTLEVRTEVPGAHSFRLSEDGSTWIKTELKLLARE